MSRYRKVDSRIWNDEKFRVLSDEAKLQFLFLLTHPHMTALGAMRGTLDGLAAEIDWPAKAFREAFREASGMAMVKHDPTASFLWLPNFLRYNKPESPNVVRAWASAADLLPECPMKTECIQRAKAFAEAMGEGFTKAFREVFREVFGKDLPLSGAGAGAGAGAVHGTRAREAIDEHSRQKIWQQIRDAYPPFAGRQDWISAEHIASTLVSEGIVTWDVLQAGVERFAKYCQAGGVSSAKYVMTPAKFFRDADRPWSQPWEIPAEGASANGTRGRRLTAADYDAGAKQRLAAATGDDPGEL